MVTSKRVRAFFTQTMAIASPAAALATAILAFAALPGPAPAQSSLADVQSQIKRYGCDLPQYASSVAGCRQLHTRARALRSGTAPYTSGRASRPAQPSSSSGGGFFSTLFGGGSSRGSYSSRSRYDTYGSGSSSYGGRSWSGSYAPYAGGYGRYRTLCVRTCDGYYFPISFSTTRTGLLRDAKRCEASCGAPAKLFYYRNPGADVEHMISLDGQPYSSMENAFRYREEYVENCRCKPEPWSEAAREMYERRAEAAENPEPVKTAENKAASGTMAGAPYEAPRVRTRSYPPQPEPRRRQRRRYRANDPAHEGRWWAGSW